jgi:hypothetical protein
VAWFSLQRKDPSGWDAASINRGVAAIIGGFGMKKLLSVLSLFAFLFLMVGVSAASAETVKGWVSDSKCGAKGASASHADCTKKCEDAGAKLVIVNDKDKSIVNVDNQDALKGHEGHYVAVTGAVSGDSMHVDKVKMLKQPKAEAQTGEHSM